MSKLSPRFNLTVLYCPVFLQLTPSPRDPTRLIQPNWQLTGTLTQTLLRYPSGSYGQGTGLSQCTGVCQPGEFSLRYAAECQNCSQGRFAARSGMEACDKCGDLMTSDPGSDSCVCQVTASVWLALQCPQVLYAPTP